MILDFISDLIGDVFFDTLEELNRERKKGDPQKLFEVTLTTSEGVERAVSRATLTIANNHKRINSRKTVAVINGASYWLGLIKKGGTGTIQVVLPGVALGGRIDVTLRWKVRSATWPFKSYQRDHTFSVAANV